MKKYLSLPLISPFLFITYKSFLPENKKLNLVFDLDNTLICSTKYERIKNTKIYKQDYVYDDNYDSEDKKYYVWKRPYSYQIVKFLSLFNNLHLYTRVKKNYADNILENIFPKIEFKNKLYREDMVNNGKDLDKIKGNDDMKIIFDDKKNNYVNKNNNFYHIRYYGYSNNNDKELFNVMFFVIVVNIIGMENVKKYNLFKNNLLKN